MGPVAAAISEIDYVELKRDFGKWPVGTRGTVLSDHGAWKLIEISNDQGVMLDLIEVAEDDLELITRHLG